METGERGRGRGRGEWKGNDEKGVGEKEEEETMCSAAYHKESGEAVGASYPVSIDQMCVREYSPKCRMLQ